MVTSKSTVLRGRRRRGLSGVLLEILDQQVGEDLGQLVSQAFVRLEGLPAVLVVTLVHHGVAAPPLVIPAWRSRRRIVDRLQ